MATVLTGFSVEHDGGSDSVTLVDAATGDEIAEVFHCDRHAVAQTSEEAIYTANLFAAAAPLLAALLGLLAVRPMNHADDDDPATRDAWRAASAAIILAGVPA